MWRLDRNHDEDDVFGSEPDAAADDPIPEPMRQDITSPDGVSLGDPELVAGNVAEPAWRRWRDELAEVGGRSPLVRFVDTPRTRIELSTTHPGGLPQFITGKSTLLSSLIRDELALRNARLAAAEITQKGIELRSVRGIESVHLAIGLASWRNGGEEFLAPVLLRPLAIRRYGRDFELKLKGQPFLNPALARELREQFRITLDAEAFVALAITNGVFKPQPVIDRLRGLTSHLPWFHVAPRLVVSSFAEVGPAMAADVERLDHPVIDAIAGNKAAQAAIARQGERARVVPFVSAGLFAAAILGAVIAPWPAAVLGGLVVVAIGAAALMFGFSVGPPGPLFVVLVFGLSTQVVGSGADAATYVAAVGAGILFTAAVSLSPLLLPSRRSVAARPLREVLPGPAWPAG